MKNRAMKIIALALCAVLLSGTASAAVRAQAADGTNDGTGEKTTGANAAPDAEVFKDETVYVLTGADGTVQKILVSDWINNAVSADTLTDRTELSNIENVKGEESYTLGGDGSCVWDSRGNDIYYQGDIEKELPVDLTVTFLLDGKQVSQEELAGQSGHVTIRFDYTNKQYEYVEIDGEKVKIYVPFVMLTGLLLDNDSFTNVEVSNGKLMNDGDRTAVIGMAFPGLQENLSLDSETLDIPDYVEITADVTNFELGMTVTLAANELFNEFDGMEPDFMDDLSEALGELTDAMDQLMDGSSRLYDGLSTLLDKSGELADGIDALASGAQTLQDGVEALDAGVSELQSGAGQIYSGLSTLDANSQALNNGAKQVFETLLSTANTQLSAAGLSVPAMTISNYAEVLNSVIASLDETAVYEQALATVTAAVEEQRSYVEEQVTAAIRSEVTQQVTAAAEEQVAAQVTETIYETVTAQVILSATGMDQESYESAVAAGLVEEEIQAAVEGAIETQMQSETVLQMIEVNTAEQMASETVQANITANVEAQMDSDAVKALIADNTQDQVEKAVAENMAGDTVQSQLTAASEGAQTVIALKASLDSYNSFYLGLLSYTDGVAQVTSGAYTLKAGTDSLKAGSGQLYDGMSQLCDGILTLQNSTPALVEGVSQLKDGAMQLSDGLAEFNEEGVQRLVEAVDGDLDELIERIRATGNVSKDYRSFSGIDNDMEGQVKFIYRTESIKAD